MIQKKILGFESQYKKPLNKVNSKHKCLSEEPTSLQWKTLYNDVTFMKEKFDNICCAQKAMSSSMESEYYYIQDAVKQKVLEEKLTYNKEKMCNLKLSVEKDLKKCTQRFKKVKKKIGRAHV